MRSDLGLRRWTKAAIYCYDRQCICEGCFYKTHLETKCQMKEAVIALHRRYGKPERKDKKMIQMQMSIIDHYGVEAQKKKLIEEMDELKEAILGNHNKDHIVEEMADVLNVLQGIIYHCGYEKQILEIQDYKLERQIRRIYDEERKVKKNGK